MKITLENLPMYCEQCGDCMLWQQGVNSTGYPQANIDGKPGQMVRRYIFLDLLKKTLKKGERVASKCGQKLCLAPDCLVPETFGRTLSKAYKSGRRMGALEYAKRLESAQCVGMAKLNWEQVTEIRALPVELTHQSIADTYGMSHKAVSELRRGITWKRTVAAASVFSWRPA